MRYLSDTNVISLLMRGDETSAHHLRLASEAGHELVLSPIADYEIRRGLIRRNAGRALERYLRVVENFLYHDLTPGVWHTAAQIWAYARDNGEPIPDADPLIAAQTLDLEAVLVTRNPRHYQVFRPLGLVLEDWTTH